MFALYSAWYFWIPKILGVEYNRSWGNIHFWILFLGVNVTFFPQHFLGLQGMPRRISDYADAFAGWNLVSSFGSLISVIATWFFLYILYVQLVHGKATSRYLWLTPQFYYDLLQTLLNRVFNSLEWGLNSPPKPHAFTSLPLQSGFFKSFIGKFNLNWFTFPLFISIIIGVGLYLAYRLPMHFMLGQLDLLTYYPLFNLMVTLCSIVTIASLKGNQIKPIQLYLAMFFAFFAIFLFWFGSGYLRELHASVFVFFTYLPFIWDSLKDIWYTIKDNTMTMPYGGSTTCYKTTPSGLSSGGGGSSAGASSTGGGASSTGGGGKSGDVRNWEDSDKTRGNVHLPEGHMNKSCLNCVEFNHISIKVTPGQHCRYCGWAFNTDGRRLSKKNINEADKREFLAARPHLQEQLQAYWTGVTQQVTPEFQSETSLSKTPIHQSESATSAAKSSTFSGTGDKSQLPHLPEKTSGQVSSQTPLPPSESSSTQTSLPQSQPAPSVPKYIPPHKRPGFNPGP